VPRWWLILLLAAVVAAVFWPRNESRRRAPRPVPVDKQLPARPDSSWLIAVDSSGRRLQPSVTREDGHYVIRCPGYVTEAYLPHAGDERPLRITLTPADTLRGRVLLGNLDHPAVDVGVECYEWPDVRTARTGKDGRFELPDLNPATTKFLDLVLPGLAPPEMTCRTSKWANWETLIILGDGPALRGKVVDADGAPVAGMPVLLRGHFRRSLECDGESFAVVSGPDGTFEFRELGPFEYRVVARDETRRGESVITAIDEGKGDRTCLVVVSEQPRLRVRVIAPDGSPVENARVTTERERGRYFPAVAPGVYVSGPLSLGTQPLFVAADGWSERYLEAQLDRVEEREIEVRFEDAHTLRARVVDDIGRPVTGASVSMGTAETDAEGRIVIRGLTATPVALRIEHDGHNPVAVVAAPTNTEHRITMLRAATLTGRFDPVPASREVRCRILSTEFDSANARVDVFGRFAVRGLPAGVEFDITFEIDGWVGLPMRGVALAPGEEREVGVLRPPPGATLEGVVRDNYGRPVEGAELNLESRMQDAWDWETTDAAGTYRFADLPQVKAVLDVDGPGVVRRTIELELGGRQVLDIVVIRSGLLAGTAKGVAELRLEPVEGGQPLRWEPEDDGTFAVNSAPGRYRLQYRLRGSWIAADLVDVVEGEETRVAVAVSDR
jgi:hypothetical protein